MSATQANIVESNASDVEKVIARTKFRSRAEKTVTLDPAAFEILKGWGIEKGEMKQGLTLALRIADIRIGEEMKAAIERAKKLSMAEKPNGKEK